MVRFAAVVALVGASAFGSASAAVAAPVPVIEPSPASSFGTPLVHPTSLAPSELVVADVDEDGTADFLTLRASTGIASVMLGAGAATTPVTAQIAATFHVAQGPADTNAAAGGLAAADLNRDGHLDLIAYNNAHGKVLVARGAGDGTFATPVEFDAFEGKEPASLDLVDLIVADANGDGKLDVVVVARGARTVTVLRGDGLGLLAATRSLLTPLGAGGRPVVPTSLVAGDLDDDGHLDLVVSSASAVGAGAILVYRGDGTSGFEDPLADTRTDVPSDVALADLNEDGKPDLVYREIIRGGGGVRAQLGSGDGTFSAVLDLENGEGQAPPGIADLNGDGHLDLALLGGTRQLYNRLGYGDATYGTATVRAAGPQEFRPTVADFDGDGDPDVATLGSDGVHAYRNTGTPAAGATKALISELRSSGPGGDGDEYVQIFNRSITAGLDVGGWALRTSGGGPRLQHQVTIPYGTVIPRGGHLLVAMTPATGYSLGSAGGSVLQLPFGASGPEALPGGESGVALLDPAGATVDAVGFTGAPAGFVEGDGLLPITAGGQLTYLRRYLAGVPRDTGDNRADFVAVDTAPVSGSGATLGAPRPDGLSAPTVHTDFLQSSLPSPRQAANESPNAIVRQNKDGSKFLTINRVITNCSGLTIGPCVNAKPGIPKTTITKLRFRITGLTTEGSPGTGAILKAGTTTVFENGQTAPVGLTLEAPSVAASGGLNATLAPTRGLPAGGLKSGASIVVAFQFLVVRGGSYLFAFNAEDDLIAETDEAPTPTPAEPTPAEPTPAATVEPVPDTPSGPATNTGPVPVLTELPPASAATDNTVGGVVPGPTALSASTAPAVEPLRAGPAAKTPATLVCKGKKSVLIKKSKTKSGRVVPARCVTKQQAVAIKKAAAKQQAAAKKKAAAKVKAKVKAATRTKAVSAR